MPHLLLISVLLIMILSSAYSIPPPARSKLGPTNQAPPTPAQEFLAAHNQARAEVGVGPLTWSLALANATARLGTYQRVKSACNFADLSSDKIKYGANQLRAQGAAVSPTAAVAAWVAEKKFYNHGNDTCVGSNNCGVYRQVVWRDTVEVGCAQARCVKDTSSLTICFYNPPGNVDGQTPY